MEGAGGTSSLHALYDWGATVTLVTHAAAAKAGLKKRVQVAAAVAGGSHDSSNLSTILTLDERKITIKLIFIKNTPRVVDSSFSSCL